MSHENHARRTPGPTPARRLWRDAVVVAALVGATACADSALAPEAANPPVPPPSLTTYDAASRTLGVSIVSSVNKYGTEGGYTVHSSVTGGVGPFMYIWYIARSTAGGATDFQLYDEGWGKDSIQFYVYPDDMQIVIRLSVGDSQVPTWTGYYRRSFLGPAAVHANDTITTPCYTYDPGIRFDDGVPPDLDHKSTWYHDACTWARIYDPK